MEEEVSRIKLVADEVFEYLLKKYREGVISVRLGEIEEYICEKYCGKLFKDRLSVNSYVNYVVKRLQRHGVIIITKEIGEKGYRISFTLNYLNSSMYGGRR